MTMYRNGIPYIPPAQRTAAVAATRTAPKPCGGCRQGAAAAPRGQPDPIPALPPAYGQYVTAPPRPPAVDATPNILFVSQYLRRDGAPTWLLHVVTHLRHCRATVFSFHDGPLRQVYEAAGVRVILGDADNIPDPTWYDLVVANTTVSAPAVRVALEHNVPVVWLVHEATPDWTGNRAELVELMPRVAATVFPTDRCRVAYTSVRPANPLVMPTLVPPVPVRDRDVERTRLGWGDTFTVVTFGQDEPRKGQADVRAAVEGLDGVRLVTAYDQPDPHGYLAAADLYVCTSRDETFPLSTQEAAAHGLPVVSTPAGLLSGVAGDVYQPGDVTALRDLIIRHRDVPARDRNRPLASDFHRTIEWYSDLFRSAVRRLPSPAASVRVVYHVAGLGGHWQQVVAEQLDQLRAAGLTRVLCTHVGEGRPELIRMARAAGVELTVCASSPDVTEYERPGIRLVHSLAHAGDSPILYLHSKAVSRSPETEWYYHDWRRLQMRETVGGWRRSLGLIEGGADAVGVNWWADPKGHFSGNIWMAAAEWLRKLPDPDEYYATAGHGRYACERWLGAVPGCRAKSLLVRDKQFWERDRDLLTILLHGHRKPT